VVVDGELLNDGEYDFAPFSEDPTLAVQFLSGDGYVVLDTQVSEELKAEGLANDIVRDIQNARKAEGLDVSDRVRLKIAAPPETLAALGAHEDKVSASVLSVHMDLVAIDVDGDIAESSGAHQLSHGALVWVVRA
jgi:isoleucyl-tRNA synthetase